MSVQTSYRYSTPRGVAGSLFDISPYSIDSRVNGEKKAGTLMFGMGAVTGDNPGTDVKRPGNSATAEAFDGVVLTGFSNQQTMDGVVEILPLQTVGILRYGKAWVRIVEGDTPKYGDKLYLIKEGDDAGFFTTIGTGAGAIEIKGRFIGSKGTGNVAPIELFNQSQN